MLTKAKEARHNAYAPYSKYKVGACVMTPDRQYFNGCNVENISYSLTACAEGSAICNMVTSGYYKIGAILVISSGENYCMPCGACRQIIREFSEPTVPIYACNSAGNYKIFTIDELLAHSFFEKTLQHE
jgi:cytidine deaminase